MSRVLPILFNTEMVGSILDDRKNVTRRCVKFLPGKNPNWAGYVRDGLMLYNGRNEPCIKPPRYKVGDYLYVRETWAFQCCIECVNQLEDESCMDGKVSTIYEDKDVESEGCYIYRAGHQQPKKIVWHPSIHMPKEAARIWLKVTDVRVESLNDMTLDDFLAEGVVLRPEAFNDPENAYWQARKIFSSIWDSTIPKKDLDKYSFEANPWVFVNAFEKCEKPEGWCL